MKLIQVPPDLKIDILTHAEKHNANLLIVNAILEDVTHGLDELILKVSNVLLYAGINYEIVH